MRISDWSSDVCSSDLGMEEVPALARTPEIIGEAPAMQEVFRAIGRLSHSNITVLINGESGTGKELGAHAMHRPSPRADSPLIAPHMAAIRSADGRVGKERVSKCRSRESPEHYKQ